jgi:hypothetical protein
MWEWRYKSTILILALDGAERSVLCPGRFTPGKGLQATIAQKTGWVLGPIWTLWGRETYITHARNRHPLVQLVAWQLYLVQIYEHTLYTLGESELNSI